MTISPGIVRQAISKLKLGKARGPDGIPNSLLKGTANELSISLAFIFQTAVNKGVFPERWKESWTSPIFKRGSRSEVSNNRPVTLLDTTSKVFERVIFDQLYEHVRPYLHESQFGFRQRRSAITQMLLYLDELYRNFDDKSVENLHACYIDFEKAFDRVDHSVLKRKLAAFGVSGKLLQLLMSYLSNRNQVTVINECISPALPITSGVPQGSILGPLLFLIYVNDLPRGICYTNVYTFADDTKLLATCPWQLQHDLDILSDWCANNNMSVNGDKCSILSFRGTCEASISHKAVKNASSEKDLGIIISDKLDWTAHVTSRVGKALNAFYLVKRNISRTASSSTKLAIYCGYIMPVLSYGSILYRANRGSLRTLESVQRKATHWIMGYNSDMRYKDRLSFLHLLPVTLYLELHEILFLHSILSQKYDFDWEKYVSFRADLSTRSSSSVKLQVRRTLLKKTEDNFWCRVSSLINLLSDVGVDVLTPTLPSLKDQLTVLYWNFFDALYNENSPALGVFCVLARHVHVDPFSTLCKYVTSGGHSLEALSLNSLIIIIIIIIIIQGRG